MERFAFIHGSSVGQSAFIPTGGPSAICNDIAAKYFQGRTLRQKESGANKALFVELYRDTQGLLYCLYSFVNNACYGANGREGQYFAISIICKGIYVYPEILYDMLYSAYKAMFKTGKIIRTNENGEDQFVVSQFIEQKDYLSALLKKIESSFDEVLSGGGQRINEVIATANYDSWKGTKYGLDICNATSAFRTLTESGRIYISEEYESSTEIIKNLRNHIQKLQSEKAEIENRYVFSKQSERNKVQEEIEELNAKIRQQSAEINALKSENSNYETTIGIVSKELEKYAKASKPITDLQNKKQHIKEKDRKDVVKLILLIGIFILTLLCAIANFSFFRDITLSSPEMQTGVTKQREDFTAASVSTSRTENPEETILIVNPNEIQFDSSEGTQTIYINSDVEWTIPEIKADWISLEKEDDNNLIISVTSNDTPEERSVTFMVTSNDLEKQVKVFQAKKTAAPLADYIITVKDENGTRIMDGDSVNVGQTLFAKVLNRKLMDGYGWCQSNCSLSNGGKNTDTVTVTIEGHAGQIAVFSYGLKGDNNRDNRTKFYLNIR